MKHDVRAALRNMAPAWLCVRCGRWRLEEQPLAVWTQECDRERPLPAGFGWIDGVADAVVDHANADLIQAGRELPVQELRDLFAHCAPRYATALGIASTSRGGEPTSSGAGQPTPEPAGVAS